MRKKLRRTCEIRKKIMLIDPAILAKAVKMRGIGKSENQ